MKLIKTFPFLLFLFTVGLCSQTQKQIIFKQLSVNDGLSQNSVVSIAQDSIGYLWFATQDGLNKYDGITYKYYQKLFEDITKEDYSKLGKVYVDRQNKLYIITKDGVLEKFNTELDSFQKVRKFRSASTIFQDRKLETWIGTYGNGLYKIGNRSKDTLQILKNEDVLKEIFAISEYNGNIIVAASESVFEINNSTLDYKQFSFLGAKPKVNFGSIATDQNNRLWVGSFGEGLYINESGIFKRFQGFNSKNILPIDLNIESLLVDSKNRLWVGTYGNGAYLIDFSRNTVTNFRLNSSNPKSIHYNDILSIVEDYSGTIWFGTDGAGLSYYDENLNKFNSLTNSEIPDYADVAVARSLVIDDAGHFWIGTSGKGLTKYDPDKNEFRSYKNDPENKNSIPSNRVMSLLSEKDKLWIGMQDEGLAILQNGIFKHYNENTSPSLPATTIWCIFKDSFNHYWLGTRDKGLIQFDPQTGVVAQYTHDANDLRAISGNNIRTIIEAEPGVLWIGTENNGLSKFLTNEETFFNYSNKSIESIKSLYYENPTLWIGTNGKGLQAFNTQNATFYTYSKEDGLPNNVIYSILPDAMGNLWLSSNRGISRFSVDQRTGNTEIINYDTYDGLQAMEFNTGASHKDKNGVLYFGGLNGINWFKPEELSKNPVPPKTIISKIEIFDEEIPMTPDPEYGYKENTITFSFAGLHFSQPERNHYKYQLTNYDNTWSKASNTNFARYTNLPSGEYQFQVLSSNYDGIWDTTPASYSFTIRPPWYLTTVAKIAYLLAFLIALYLLYKYLKWRWQMQVKLQLESQETERLKKLDELKSKLYTNISHEFRTPLTLISGPVNELLAKAEISDRNKRSLSIIEASSQRMLSLVNQLLDLSKLESKAVTLQVGSYDLNAHLSQIIEAFTHQANDKGLSIATQIDEFDVAWYDKDIVEKIVFNLLSNAIKYAPENTAVFFGAKKSNGHMSLTLQNVAENLSASDMDKLFERFYQVDRNSEGVGIGLSLIKELTVLCEGKVSVEKIKPNLISFLIEIPISKENYNANEIIKDSPKFDFVPSKTSEIFSEEKSEKPLILIVEDNIEVRKYLVSLFTETYKVIEGSDGLIGIKKAIKSIPDLIISDIMMPHKNGIELCNTLKTDTRTSHIPIILVTAKVDDQSELTGLKNMADDYITKPFNAEIVKQKVINIINARRLLRERYSQNVYLRPSDIAIVPADEEFLENVQKVIDTKITSSSFTSEEFAKDLRLSRMQLHRKLKALTGLSTSEFIRSQRLKLAINLLEESDLTIAEIGYSVGFNTPSYFTKCFKEEYKCSPSEYGTQIKN